MIYSEKIKNFAYFIFTLLKRNAQEKFRWRNELKYDYPRLFYGHEHVPSRNERSGGAAVKFQDLSESFANNVKNANILYLVSSFLPTFPQIIVREAKKAGVIFVLNQNGVAYPAWHGPGWEKTNLLMRFLLDQADYVIYQSEFCKTGADTFLGRCSSPWTILHNPVDTKVFQPVSKKPSGLKLLLAGSHQHFYRIKSALEMMGLLKQTLPLATLTIAGRYSWRQSETECLVEMKQLAANLGVLDRVKFSGAYTQFDAPGIFQSHHILIHTQYNDCCPRLVVEAMAGGLPIVYSKSGGVPELVGDEAGQGVDAPLDWELTHAPLPEDLVRATQVVVSSYDAYSRAARKRATEKFDVRPWRDRHKKIFEELLDNKCNTIN